MIRRVAGALFGYDFFIAYARKDGRAYAEDLKRLLQERRFDCFLDSESYIAGDDWKRIGAWSLARTSYLIVVASTAALESEAVLREVRIFKRTGRRSFAIDFDGSLTDGASSRVARLLGKDSLQLRETKEALAFGEVAPEVLLQLDSSFDRARQETKRLRWIGAVAMLLSMLTVVALVFALAAAIASRRANRALLRTEDVRLAGDAQLLMTRRPQRAALMALEAAKLTHGRGEELSAPLRTALYATLNNLSGEPLADDASDVAMSADGLWLLARTRNETIRLWRLTDRATVVCTELALPSEEAIQSAIFTPDSRSLLAGGLKGNVVKAVLPPTNRCPALEPVLRTRSAVDHLELSPDGRWLLVHDKDDEWVLASWPATATVPRHRWKGTLGLGEPYFDPSSRSLVTAEGEGALCIRDLAAPISAACPRRIVPPGGSANHLAFTPDGRRLAVSAHSQVALWSLGSARNVEPDCTSARIEMLYDITFSRSGRFLYGSGNLSKKSKHSLFVIDFSRPERCPQPAASDIEIGTFLADVEPLGEDGMAAVTWTDARLVTWNAATGHAAIRNTDALYKLRMKVWRARSMVIVTGGERPIEAWPVHDDELRDPRVMLRGFNDGDIDDLLLSPDGRWLAATGDATDLRLWHFDREGSTQPETTVIGAEEHRHESWASDGRSCVIETSDGLVRWNFLGKQGPEARTLPVACSKYCFPYLSPSGRWLAVQDETWACN